MYYYGWVRLIWKYILIFSAPHRPLWTLCFGESLHSFVRVFDLRGLRRRSPPPPPSSAFLGLSTSCSSTYRSSSRNLSLTTPIILCQLLNVYLLLYTDSYIQKMHALLIHTRTAFVNINICNPFRGFRTDGNFCIRKNVSGKETWKVWIFSDVRLKVTVDSLQVLICICFCYSKSSTAAAVFTASTSCGISSKQLQCTCNVYLK